MIVRELISLFGLGYDPRGEKRAERGIRTVQSQVEGLQAIMSGLFVAGMTAGPAIALAKFASDAQENKNLLEVMFVDAAKAVETWSVSASAAMGRSRYTLQKLASEFGGLVGAMVGPGQQAAEMSTQLAELAVNLSSLRNISEERALVVLQSALAGETEAIKRYGADLSALAQDREADRLGLGKQAKDLQKHQKAQVRFNILMRDLGFVSGDAAKTLDQFANSSRALRDGLKDLATEIGFMLIPPFEKMMKGTRDFLTYAGTLVRDFREWAGNTNLVAGALAGIALVLGVQLIPLLLRLVPMFAAFALFAIVMDDLFTFLEGGDSVIGRLTEALDEFDRVGSSTNDTLSFLLYILSRIRDAVGWVAVAIDGLVKGLTGEGWTQFRAALEILIGDLDKFGKAWKKVASFATAPFKAVDALAQAQKQYANAAGTILGGIVAGHGLKLPTAPQVAAGLQAGPSTIGRESALPSGLGAKTVTVHQGNRTYSFEVYQQPGEHPDDFARRVTELMDARDEALEQSLEADLLPAIP